jgi:hypothetical protein
MCAVGAGADPNRYEWRAFGGANVDLKPLFAWWTFASETTNQAVDITEMNPRKLEAVSNIWAHLPARPLPDWFRLSSTEDSITIVGDMWRVDAVIEAAPMLVKHQVIYLRSPPVKEIHDFKQARAQYNALENGQSSQAAAVQAQESSLQKATVPYPGTYTVQGGVVVARTGAIAVQHDLAAAAAVSNQVQAADVNQLATLGTYLASFPSTNVYYLDHFALRTGKMIDGLEVYDLGGAAGLNY